MRAFTYVRRFRANARIFDLLETGGRQFAYLSFGADCRKRPNTLHVCQRHLLKESQLWKGTLIVAVPVLGGHGNINHQCFRRRGIVARHDHNGSRLGGQPQAALAIVPRVAAPALMPFCPWRK